MAKAERAWSIPRLWEGGECWIIGGGASILEQFSVPEKISDKVRKKTLPLSALSPYLTPLHGKHVIGTNKAFLLGDWVDVLMFGDFGFFAKNRREILDFPGIKISCHRRFRTTEFDRDKIKYVPRNPQKSNGMTLGRNQVSWNMNTGACTINLAYHLGCKKIYLVGFDMYKQDGRQHFHNEYRTLGVEKSRDTKAQPFGRHLKGFPRIAADCHKAGVEVINCNPKSRIGAFERVNVKEVL